MATEVKAMVLKKAEPATTSKEAAAKGLGIIEFVSGIKEEFGRITWTSPDELRTYTKIVVGTTFALGLGIYCVDFLIQATLNVVGYVFHMIFG
ncbi:MAG: preprotein translocase subunit SecE [Parachlamydiaceae bacterium]|nr:preprotein translocase subunit SecE [Parachlamydiaceae bacterium]